MKSKYHNRKTTIDGITFDSIKEAKRYQELNLLQKAGLIVNLNRQISFELIPKTNTERAVKYIADFMYVETVTGKIIVEDVKGYRTDVYKIKRKLFKFRYPNIIFRET